MNHIIEQSLFPPYISGFHLFPIKIETYQSGGRSHIQESFFCPIQTKHVVYRFLKHFFQRNHFILFCSLIKPYESFFPTAKPQYWISLGQHRIEHRYFPLTVKEMVAFLRFETNATCPLLKYQLTETGTGRYHIKYTIIFLINAMYLGGLCRQILHTMQSLICKRVIEKPRITRPNPKAIHIMTLNQFINSKFFIPPYIRCSILLASRRIDCNGRSIYTLAVIRYMQQSVTFRPEP